MTRKAEADTTKRRDLDEPPPSSGPSVKSVELVIWENGQLGASITLANGTEHLRRLIINGEDERLMAKLKDVAPWDGGEPH